MAGPHKHPYRSAPDVCRGRDLCICRLQAFLLTHDDDGADLSSL